MQHHEFNWQNPQGIRTFGQQWQPETEPKAVVILMHGLGEHSSRYAHVAQAFSTNGFVLLTCDHMGHGKSDGKRGHVTGYDIFFHEIEHLRSIASQKYPGLPVFLYGHSLGGNIVLFYTLKKKPNFAGVIATSPGLLPAIDPGPKVIIGKILYSIMPAFTMDNGLDISGISPDPAFVQAYLDDPLNHKKVSTRLGIDLLVNGKWSLDHAAEFPLPLLLLQGSADRLVDPSASRAFANKLGEKIHFIEWPGGYHELHNGPDKVNIIQEIVAWIENVLVKVH